MIKYFCDKCDIEMTTETLCQLTITTEYSDEKFDLCDNCEKDLSNWIEAKDK